MLNTHVRTLSPDVCSGRLEDAQSANIFKVEAKTLGRLALVFRTILFPQIRMKNLCKIAHLT